MSNKNKKAKNNSKSNFLYFPNKLNVLTMFLIFVLYGVVLFGVVSLAFPSPKYTTTLNYEPATYNEEINPYVLIRGETTKDKDENFYSSTQLFAYIRAMNETNVSSVMYEYSALDSKGVMKYYLESSRTVLPVVHTSSKKIDLMDSYLEKLFVRIRYNVKEDEEIIPKEYKFSEEILQLTKKDLEMYKLGNVLEDKATVKFEFKEDSSNKDKYTTNFEITLDDKTKPHRINFQSWLVTKEQEIYPLLGLYNYCYPDKFKSSYTTSVNKYVQPEWIYSKLVYINPTTGEESELLYKTSVSDLLLANNN